MSSLISGAEPGFEPIEGYVLRERIGAGGYGEVWLADAPGGLKKAIKFVFGSIDERAGNELRSLQRIRAVHHPFILSLERIELVNNQLIVVTELADGSLFDRFQEFHQRGLVGIPRNRLLDYLRDAADALDFLCQKHDLQHLDVKPANLLLVADRVKVADFGLIKDLQNKNLSAMSGLTPTYAAPEMFDGRPGRFSDQYSLAIVYQELLTGTFPFNGRTTAQLATEHLHKAPNLDALPALERPIIGKALAKKPSQRFSSCRELVDHLARVQSDSASDSIFQSANGPTAAPSTRQTPRVAQSTPKVEGKPTISWSGRVASSDKRNVVELPAIQLPKTTAAALAPSLFIGVGGTGAEVLVALRSRLQNLGLDLQQLADIGWVQADTDEATLQRASDPATAGRLAEDEMIFMPLKAAQEYRQRSQDAFTPLSRRWLYNVPRSLATEGVRPMGTLAYLDHTAICYQHLHRSLKALVEYQKQTSEECKPIRIYLVGSAHGGTGSVLAIELAFLVRRILAELEADATVQAVLCVGEQSEFASTELATAASLACLREISHYFRTNGLYPGIPNAPADHSSNPPWHHVYLVDGGPLDKQSAWRLSIEQMTDFLCIDACTALGEVLDAARQETIARANTADEREWVPWLRMFSSHRLDLSAQLKPELLVKRLTLQAVEEWLSSLSVQESPDRSQVDPRPSDLRPEKRPSSSQHIDFFVSDLFREKRWTAQSWVRECMTKLLSLAAQDQPLESNETNSESECNRERILKETDPYDLKQLAELLRIPLCKVQATATELIETADQGLVDGLRTRWLTSVASWSQLDEVVAGISRRFTAQSQSLKSVADRFTQQRESMLNALYASDASESSAAIPDRSQQELANEIRTIDIQASIHRIAGHLLLLLGQHARRFGQGWRAESEQIVGELRSWMHSLAGELKVCVDVDGHVRDNWFPIPANWTSVRDTTKNALHQALQSIVDRRFFDSWIPSPGSPNSTMSSAETSMLVDWSITPSDTWRFDSPKLLRWLEWGTKIAHETASQAGLLATVDESGARSSDIHQTSDADPALQRNSPMPTEPHRTDELKLLANGGAKRTWLLVPKGSSNTEAAEQWKKCFGQNVTVAELDGLESAMLCVDGEQLDPSQLVHQLWLPNHERHLLAERLHSRNDIDWLPME